MSRSQVVLADPLCLESASPAEKGNGRPSLPSDVEVNGRNSLASASNGRIDALKLGLLGDVCIHFHLLVV